MNKMLLIALLAAGMLSSGLTANIRVYNTLPYNIRAVVYWEGGNHDFKLIPPFTQQHWTRDVCMCKKGIDVWVQEVPGKENWNEGTPDVSLRGGRCGCDYKDYSVIEVVDPSGNVEYSVTLSYPKGGTKAYPASDPK